MTRIGRMIVMIGATRYSRRLSVAAVLVACATVALVPPSPANAAAPG
jgi:hypothetical protein